MNKFLILICLIFSASVLRAQVEINMMTGETEACGGVFFDSGGSTGDYSSNENFTLTICPENEGDVVYVEFLTFNVSCPNPNPNNGDCDQLEVFDGENLAAGSMGTVSGGMTFTASPLNPSGCLTFQFTSNSATEAAGWSASITCETPCERPVAAATTDPDGAFPIKVCVDEEIDFDGTNSYAAAGFNITDWEWDFRDGTIDTSGPIVTHSYDEPGEYIVQLYLADDNGCASTNRTDIQIWVGTPPNVNISNSLGSYEICPDQELCLSIDAESLGVQWDAIPEVELGSGITVPDIVGECFESELEYNAFDPGQTLNSIDDLQAIYVNLEHSFMGDLLIQITCPDGTTVNLHEQGGGGTNLGLADQADNQVPGIGWDYWWSPTADLGTWVDESNSNTEPGTGFGNTLSSGTYSTVGNLEDLVGCPLNGVWSLSMCDLWGADDGTVFGWSLELNPDIYPELTTFTPVYGSDADSTYWTGNNINFTSSNQDSICIAIPSTGDYDFEFFMTNDFGCEYDTTVVVTVIEPLSVNAGADVTISCEEPYNLTAYLNATPSPDCEYNLSLLDTWGNGWDGGQLEVIIDGTPEVYTLDNGVNQNFPLTIPHEASIEIYYTASTNTPGGGQDPGQNEYTLFNSNGVLVFNDGEFGTIPTEGLAFSGTGFCFPAEPALEYSWTPTEFLTNPNSQSPTVTGLIQTTTFTAEVWLPDHPECKYTDEVTLTVAGALDPGADIADCAMSYQLNASPLANGLWSAPAGSDISFSNPTSASSTVTATTAGTYMITWTDLDGVACPTSSDIQVVFFDGIDITTAITEPFCYGECNGQVDLITAGGSIAPGTDYVYTWNDGVTNGLNGDQIINVCSGNYSVTLEDNYDCASSLTFFVAQPPAPVIDSVQVVRESCLNACDGVISVHAPFGVMYSLDGGSTFSTQSADSSLCGGTYNIVVRDGNDCEISSNTFVPSPPAPEALFSADPVRVSIYEPYVNFTNFSSLNLYNDWTFGLEQLAGDSQEESPSFNFPSVPGIYTVELMVTDSIGCQDSTTVDVEVMEEFMAFVPTAFSPNEDGINDYFELEIRDLDPVGYQFQVFDRWGNVVFETNEYPTVWNGKGAANENFYVADGVYIWHLKAQSARTTERMERTGMVTIIR